MLGTVRDTSGAIIPKANITLTNEETGIAAKTTSDESGQYDFFNVRVGRYTITAEQTGFTKFTAKGIIVNVNARQRVDIDMQVGSVGQVVNVEDKIATSSRQCKRW